MASQAILKRNLAFYNKLCLIREAEKAIIRYYGENEMKTPMHMSVGAEAIAVGICEALDKKDQILCSYRSHAVYIANTGETNAFFAELYGKATGTAKGRAGSMHLSSPKTGFLGASAIVASTLPVAIGVAYANKIKSNNKVACVFFGDGAIDEGAFWESLNMACLMKLPVLFVCEDNGYAVHSPATERHGYDSITEIVQKFKCNVFESSSTNVEEIYNLTRQALSTMRRTNKPSFLHLKYYRYLQHVGISEDFDSGYRSKDEFEIWLKSDPLEIQGKKLKKLGITEKQLRSLENRIKDRIERSIQLAKSAPFPSQKDLYERRPAI